MIHSVAQRYFTNDKLVDLQVYHVHWLKVKAQRDQWWEEERMLFWEMEFVTAFMEHWASIWKKWAMSSMSEGFSCGVECYVLRTADMWQTFANHAQLEFGKVRVVMKERTTHQQDTLIDRLTESKESGDDLGDNLTLG